MRYQHEYYQTPQQLDRERFRDEIERQVRQSETGTRKGVRVLDDGTIEHYVEAM